MRYFQREDYERRRTVLCVKSRRSGAALETALSTYTCCVVHDAWIACRKAKLGAFDLYLAVDPHSQGAAIECWRGIRAFDSNTPFVFVVRRPLPPDVESALRDGYDAYVIEESGGARLRPVMERLIEAAERRSLAARREAALVVRDDIRQRLAKLESRIQLSRESMTRAQEHVMRAYALQHFTRSGGTRSFFERLWPATYEDVLNDLPRENAAHRSDPASNL
jgi:hypothetical protein